MAPTGQCSCSSGFTAWGANLQAENGPHRGLLTHSRHRRASPQPPLFLTPVTFWTQNEREHACNPLSTPRVSAKQASSKFRAVAKRANVPFASRSNILYKPLLLTVSGLHWSSHYASEFFRSFWVVAAWILAEHKIAGFLRTARCLQIVSVCGVHWS